MPKNGENIKWVKPDLKSEKAKADQERACDELKDLEDIKLDPKDLQDMLTDGEMVELTPSMWDKIINSDHYKVERLRDLLKVAKDKKKKVRGVFKEFIHDEVTAPILLQIDKDKILRVNGDTRLMIAKLFEVTPTVWIADYTGDDKSVKDLQQIEEGGKRYLVGSVVVGGQLLDFKQELPEGTPALTPEQLASIKVTVSPSLIEEMANIAEEKALPPDKITRDALGFLQARDPKDKNAQCETCIHWCGKGELGNRCELLTATDEAYADSSCNYYAPGKPAATKVLNIFGPNEVGLVRRQVRCENCRAFNGRDTCLLFQSLNQKLPKLFDLNPLVADKDCCSAQKPKSDDKTYHDQPRVPAGQWTQGGSDGHPAGVSPPACAPSVCADRAKLPKSTTDLFNQAGVAQGQWRSAGQKLKPDLMGRAESLAMKGFNIATQDHGSEMTKAIFAAALVGTTIPSEIPHLAMAAPIVVGAEIFRAMVKGKIDITAPVLWPQDWTVSWTNWKLVKDVETPPTDVMDQIYRKASYFWQKLLGEWAHEITVDGTLGRL